jgi:hypothetical protein
MKGVTAGVNPIFRTVPIVNFCPSGHVTPRILPAADSRGSSVISSCCTTHQVNTPLNHQEPEAPPEEVEVTDPTHPLFGHRFEILSVHDAPGLVGHVHVSHRGHMRIRIELRATNLAPSAPPTPPATKLTSQAVIELAQLMRQLAERCEVRDARPAQGDLGKPIPTDPNPSRRGDVDDPHGGDR